MSLVQPPIKTPGHFASGLSSAAARRRYRKNSSTGVSYHSRKRNRTVRLGWDHDEKEDGRRLASDPTVALPGEHRRRTPRLERQEAFRAPQPWDILDTDVVVDDGELYRLGILYDDDDGNEHVRGSGFCLEAIMHSEPVYSIRPAKRAKRTHDSRLPLKGEDLHLSVELLSTYLGDDAAIAGFFEPTDNDERVQLHYDDFGGLSQHHNSKRPINTLIGPLSIIYELVESSTHSITPTPTESDPPDLILDKEEEEYEELKEDWALVLEPGNGTGQEGGDPAWLDAGGEVVNDSREETTEPVGGPWVFIAGNDS